MYLSLTYAFKMVTTAVVEIILQQIYVSNQHIVHLKLLQCVCVCVCVCARTCVQSCPTLYNPIDCSPPGSSVHGIKLTSFASPALAGRFFITCATWKAKTSTILYVNYMSIKMEKVVTMVKLVCFTIKKSVSL